ncbi:Histone H2B like protein [Argiope bruennichi]|uniref:Histone H2B like protein n=1 Tax=Argiope bruennichi TaxID=94029 RepID=A0A8T0E6J1_ARGBR|nr:Histone H2B like protein [Argiope bruennichi]
MTQEVYLDKSCKRCRQILYANSLNFNKYIREMLKEIDEDAAISKPAIQIIDKCIKKMFDEFANEVQKLMEKEQKRTLNDLDVKNATMKLLRKEVANKTIAEAQKTIAKFKGNHSDSD